MKEQNIVISWSKFKKLRCISYFISVNIPLIKQEFLLKIFYKSCSWRLKIFEVYVDNCHHVWFDTWFLKNYIINIDLRIIVAFCHIFIFLMDFQFRHLTHFEFLRRRRVKNYWFLNLNRLIWCRIYLLFSYLFLTHFNVLEGCIKKFLNKLSINLLINRMGKHWKFP